ncbi:MAG: RNA polymerase sigma factor [Anaerolineales bacterium]|nr:RNA polymerase sigma factor [Anaerolineales bacterium]MCB8962305.1 RNA polymerase sigma factor [Ardenticatenales bacterium]MCB0005754.1 RNA polymerase sigma factor [Anaerolineales bacterium]MCB0011753.1 RNA polymerase sigma factor [Anaerolineales bacterium]MCB0019248.1 RNA polymerase sigma factor [Anaerolineales bacterium]
MSSSPILSELTDDELVVAAVARGNRDDRPFRELWRRHQRMVYRTCYSFFRNGEDAEDLTQDVFLKAYRNLKGFEGRSSFKTWINRIAINSAQNEIRRRSRRPRDSEADLQEMSDYLPAPKSQSVEAAYAQISLSEQLTEALQTLRPEEYEVIYLKDVEDWGYAEIAEHLEIGLSAAKMRVQRARLALKVSFVQVAGEEGD